MKAFLPLATIALFITGCTTAYNSGQTPDDVYFSPERPQDEYVRMESNRDRYRYEETEDDRYLRMKVRNRRIWSDLDFYYNDPVAYNYYYHRNFYGSFHSPWNYYSTWNYYHNPYSYYNPWGNRPLYGTPIFIGGKGSNPVVNRPRQYNLNVYDRNVNNSPRISTGNKNNRVFYNGGGSQPNYRTPSRNTGNSLRGAFGNSSSGSNSSGNSAVRSQSSSSSSSSGSSSSGRSSGSTAPVRKF